MNFWEVFWPLLLLVSVVAYSGLAIIVAIGGFSDIRAMLRSIENNRDATQDDSEGHESH